MFITSFNTDNINNKSCNRCQLLFCDLIRGEHANEKKKKKGGEEEKFWANKQLLDEIEYNILDYQNRDLSCFLDPKDEEDNADTDITFNKSWLHTKNEFNNFLIK